MSESYSCNGEWIHFSNSACQELQLAWARIADSQNDIPGMRELAQSLKERSEFGGGDMAVGIDDEYLEEPFSRIEIKILWLKVMDQLMIDIRNNGAIAKGMDINWNAELIDSWIKRLATLRSCLARQIET